MGSNPNAATMGDFFYLNLKTLKLRPDYLDIFSETKQNVDFYGSLFRTHAYLFSISLKFINAFQICKNELRKFIPTYLNF